MHEWFSSYLKSRKQYVINNNSSSNIDELSCGVPQGSVLGPILFLIYINDIDNIPTLKNQLKLFADDTNLFVSGKSITDIELRCNTAISLIEEWMLANKLTINVDKTCYMLFLPNSSSHSAITIDLFLNNVKIKQVQSTKFLGVTLDNNLSWKIHIKEIYSDLLKFPSLFYKLRSKLPHHVLKNIYFCLVYPKILYCIEIYANTYSTYLDNLIVLNNKILRVAQDKPFRTHSCELYSDYNTLPINVLFKYNLLLLAHRLYYHKNTLPTIFSNYLQTNNLLYSYNTRSKHLIHISSVNKNFGARQFNYMGAKLWNSLPADITTIQDITVYKRTLKNYFTQALINEY